MTLTAPALIGDIGGTNARFALIEPGNPTPQAVVSLPCRQYPSLEAAVADYLGRAGIGGVSQACLAVASPLRGPEVRMTNNPWQFHIDRVQRRFGWRGFKVINDFAAMALGVLHVPDAHREPICGGPGDPKRARLILGPGTGLGMAGLIPLQHGWVPLVTEGGHVSFAPCDDTEMAIQKLLQAEFGRVSVERILSGPGLVSLYQAHAQIRGRSPVLHSPEAITSAAVEGSDPLAQEVLRHFCELLGRTAGDAVLALGSLGGVYLCGGILPRILEFFRHSSFAQAFTAKGRMTPLLEQTPVYVIIDPHTGLLGAAAALSNPEV